MTTRITSFPHRLRALVTVMAVLLLSSCGGGGAYNGDAGSTEASGLPAGTATRLEVDPPTLMLTAAGDNRALKVRAFDASGREISAKVSWQSSRSEQVTVDNAGVVKALQALGASQVVATADGVQSAPVLVSTVEVAPGVILVSDSQVTSTPVAVVPGAEPSPDNQYEVVLSGLPVPAVGSLLLGREGKTVGGEVVSAQAEGTAVRVRLKLADVSRLVQRASINEVMDLSRQPLRLAPAIDELYTVVQTGDEYVFTPKPAAFEAKNLQFVQTASNASLQRIQTATGAADGPARPLVGEVPAPVKRSIGPLECELVSSATPFSLSQPAQFSVKFDPRLEFSFDANDGLRKLLLTGSINAKLKTALQFNVGGLINLTCEAKLYEKVQPLPGWIGLVAGGMVTAGVGFEMEETLTAPLFGLESTLESKSPFRLGLDCTAGSCERVNEVTPETTLVQKWNLPSVNNIVNNLRADGFVFGYGFAKLKAGLTLVPEVRADVVTARLGGKFDASLGTEQAQLAEAPVDYRADYKLNALLEVAVGSFTNTTGDSAVRKLLRHLGIFKFSTLKFQVTEPLATSPKGTVTVDKAVFQDGDRLGFSVQLDPATTRFLGVGYNVTGIRVFRVADGKAPRQVASLSAKGGEAVFDLAWTAEGTAGETGGAFHAFVDTVLPAGVGLEVGKATLAPAAFSGRFRASYATTEATSSGTGSTSSLTETLALEGRAVQGDFNRLELLDLVGTRSFVADSANALRRTIFDPRTGDCSFTQTASLAQRADQSALAGTASAEMNILANEWRLNNVLATFRGATAETRSTTFTNQTAGCALLNLQGTSTFTPGDPRAQTQGVMPNFREPTDLQTRAWQRGSFGINPATGRRTIKALLRDSGPIPSGNPQTAVTRSYELELDMEEAERAATTDLGVTVTAAALVTPLGTMTYAVNIMNTGSQAATAVRAEIAMPARWVLVGTTGWDGCDVIGSNITCKTSTLAAGERRAFLVDVQAPAGTGRYTARARVSAAERDSNLGDNLVSAVTEIAIPPSTP